MLRLCQYGFCASLICVRQGVMVEKNSVVVSDMVPMMSKITDHKLNGLNFWIGARPFDFISEVLTKILI